MAERVHRFLKAALLALSNGRAADWDAHLSSVTWAYNASDHDGSGYSPFFIEHGRVPRLGEELSAPVHPHQDKSQFIQQLTATNARAHEVARSIQHAARSARAERRDRQRTGRKYAPGDWVLVRRPRTEANLSKKLLSQWLGPAQVQAVGFL